MADIPRRRKALTVSEMQALDTVPYERTFNTDTPANLRSIPYADPSKPNALAGSQVWKGDKTPIINWKKIGNKANDLIPFASNIVNSFRQAPSPSQPVLNEGVTLPKLNLENERYQVRRGTYSNNRATERNVPGNTAEAIKLYNRGQEENQITNINDRENQGNMQIASQQAGIDMSVQNNNASLWNKYNSDVMERNIAQQREQSGNLANAADKYVLMQDEKRKADLDMQKARVLRSLYSNSGVLDRNNGMGTAWKTAGLADPFGENYGWVKPQTKALGGRIPSRKVMC